MEKIEKTRSWFFKKTTKIDRSLKKIDQKRMQIQKWKERIILEYDHVKRCKNSLKEIQYYLGFKKKNKLKLIANQE